MKLSTYFGSYKKSNTKQLIKYISILEKKVEKYYNFGKPFFKGNFKLNYKEYLQKCELNYNSMTPENTFDYISPLFQNLPNWNNPGTMINVIPPVNLISMASISFAGLYNSNFAQDTYAGLLIAAELEVAKYISDLVSWNWQKSYGVFTFGGKGTSLYATKIALNKCNPEIPKIGCENGKYFMITTATAHPCHYQVCDWLGIGTDSCIIAPCDENERINIKETEEIIHKNIKKGKIFLGFNLNGGSTNELTVDPIKKIYEMNLKIVHKFNLGYQPHIHVDSVLGWVSLFFNDYNYKTNPLNINEPHLNKIKSLNSKVREIKYADSIGVDFHKTGFCPYVSSIFIVKNKKDFYRLNPSSEKSLDELQYGNYSPYETTLELTRACTGAIAALTCLKSLGVKGFQEIISTLFSSTEYFRETLTTNKNICVINPNTEGFATLFIIKPKIYLKKSLNDILNLPETEINYIKNFNINYGKFVLDKGKNREISFTFTSSRSYMIPGTKIKLGALKAYPMSVFLNRKEVKRITNEIFTNIDEYINNQSNISLNNQSISDDMVYRVK
ncbi:MAG: pyridoxal-dependent decarboxylase [Candidatus Shapirobacteria bacterium]